MREQPYSIQKFKRNGKEPWQMLRMDQSLNSQLNIICCFFVCCFLCISWTWSTRDLGPCFFLKISKFSPGHHAGFSVRSPHAGAKRQWSCLCWSHQTHENHVAGRESRGWWKPPKRGLLCAWKMGYTGKKHCTNLYHQFVAILRWKMDFNGF